MYSKTLGNFFKNDKFLGTYALPKLNQKLMLEKIHKDQ